MTRGQHHANWITYRSLINVNTCLSQLSIDFSLPDDILISLARLLRSSHCFGETNEPLLLILLPVQNLDHLVEQDCVILVNLSFSILINSI